MGPTAISAPDTVSLDAGVSSSPERLGTEGRRVRVSSFLGSQSGRLYQPALPKETRMNAIKAALPMIISHLL